MKFGIHFAIVDYIQNVKISGRADEEATLATVAKALKNLAKELDITIFAVSPSSAVTKTSRSQPSTVCADLGIEETADIILLDHRPEITTSEHSLNRLAPQCDGRAMMAGSPRRAEREPCWRFDKRTARSRSEHFQPATISSHPSAPQSLHSVSFCNPFIILIIEIDLINEL